MVCPPELLILQLNGDQGSFFKNMQLLQAERKRSELKQKTSSLDEPLSLSLPQLHRLITLLTFTRERDVIVRRITPKCRCPAPDGSQH